MDPYRFIAIALVTGITVDVAPGQSSSPPTGRLYQVRDSMQTRFDSLRAVLPDSVFYQEGGEYSEFQKYFRHWDMRLAPHGDHDTYDQMFKSYCDLNFQSGASFKSNTDPWLELGPRRRTGFGIGPIRNIVISADDPDHMLCTSSSGGLFYTTDAAGSWHNAGTDIGWPHSGCQDAVYYPGSTDKWFAISAYALLRGNRLSMVGGIYRTGSSGAAWDHIGDHNDFGGADTEAIKLLFDRKPNFVDQHRLFLATNRGLFYTDQPLYQEPFVPWFPIFVGPQLSIQAAYPGCSIDSEIRVHDIEYLPYDPDEPTSTLCAAMQFTVTHSSGTFKIWRFMISTDNGINWNEIANQPAIDPAIWWATVETSAAASKSFYCKVLGENSTSWVKAYDTEYTSWGNNPASNFSTIYGAGHAFGVDPNDANSIFVGNGVRMKWFLNGSSALSSINNGHDDVEDIVGDPANQGQFWIANHGGISKLITTTNPIGSSWTDQSDGLGVAEVDAIAGSDSPDYIVASWFHDGTGITRTPYSSSEWDPHWEYLGLARDGTRCLIDRYNPDHVIQSGQEGEWKRHNSATTSTAGTNFNIKSQWWSEGELNRKRPDHIYRSVLDPTSTWSIPGQSQPHTNYEMEILRSFDRGVTNEVISAFKDIPELCRVADVVPGWDNAETIYWIKSNPANPDHLYVAMQNWDWQNRIFRNTDIDEPDVPTVQANWEEIPHPRRATIGTQDAGRHPHPTGIAFDPEDENIIYIAYASSHFQYYSDITAGYANKMVFKIDLTDHQNNFPASGEVDCDIYPCQDITMNLPNTVAGKMGLVYEQGSDDGLYLATEVGVYFTNRKRILAHDPNDPANAEDLSNTSGWVRLGNGLPHVSSNGIEINYTVNRIRNGLFGRGTWEHGLHCPESFDLLETGTYANNDFMEAENDIASTSIVPISLTMKYRAGNEIRLDPGFHATHGSKFHAFIHPCDAPGNSFTPKNLPANPPELMRQREEKPEPLAPLLVYPNPSSGIFTAEIPASEGSHLYRLSVQDALGRTAYTTTTKTNVNTLDLQGRTGLFLLIVEGGGTRWSTRIIVE